MRSHFVLVIATSLACCWAAFAGAEDKPSASTSAVPIAGITSDAFDKLSDDAIIDVNGQRMTKKAFVTQRQSAIKQAEQKARSAAKQATTVFQAQRKAFLASQAAKLKEANAKTQAEIDRALAASAAAHGPDWEPNKKQALKLLDQAAKASGDQQTKLATQALDLLKQPVPKP